MKPQIWHQHYDPGVPASIDYPDQRIDQLLSQTVQKYPDQDAIIFSGGVVPLLGEQHSRMTYRLLESLVSRFAAGLQAHGLQKGDRVALYLPNCPQYVIAYYGTLRAGGIVVPTNPLYTMREVEHQLNDSGSTFIVVLSMLYKNVREIRPHTPLKQVIVTNIKEHFPFVLRTLFTLTKEKADGHRVDISGAVKTMWFNDFLENSSHEPTTVDVSMDDTAVLMYTGGTTGTPKGAQLTHKNIVANPTQAEAWLRGVNARTGQEVMLTALPLTHSYSMTACLNLSIIEGYTQVMIPNPRNIPHVLTAIDKHQVTMAPGVPTLYNAIANHPDVRAGKYSLKSINFCLSGAAGLPSGVHAEFTQRTGSKLVEAYGLSEASPAVVVNPLGSGGRIGTIGVPLCDTEVKIVDAENESEPLGVGEAGVLCVRGPQVMVGYWKQPEETANTLRTHEDGKVWLHTGDIAEMSEDGYFRIVDRKKDIIMATGGFNVYPRDVEERLYEHPKIMEAAAVGIPPASSNQRVKVYIVLHKDEMLSEEEVIDWCHQGLARYKVPKVVEFRDELPKTMVGKVFRRALVEEEVARMRE